VRTDTRANANAYADGLDTAVRANADGLDTAVRAYALGLDTDTHEYLDAKDAVRQSDLVDEQNYNIAKRILLETRITDLEAFVNAQSTPPPLLVNELSGGSA
jgi:hypothetical protein